MNETETLRKALLMIQKLKKKLNEQTQENFQPIAIVGMSSRLPNAVGLSAFWDLLLKGKNVISKIPDSRWQLLQGTQENALRDNTLSYWGGYLEGIEQFDAYFFGISPREALRMDPQQRLLLEVAYEAITDAGLSQESIKGRKMGVFTSLYASQYGPMQTLDSEMDALLLSTGTAVSIAANRLSYLFDLHGPSLNLDTACSSSLIALQLACLSIQNQQCESALVGAVNINLLPSLHALLSKATLLSPTGQCHTFDAKADGYVQGEGVGAVIIKPLAKALIENDKIYAVISGYAMNQDGKTNGLTAPNGLKQEALLKEAYKMARINPDEIGYLECHGTGTFLGDPIEVQALGEALGGHNQCFIGSVKTNVGHLEPAAGIISLIKTALVLKHGIIPPHLNFTQPNPYIPFDKYRFSIPLKPEKLPVYGDYAVAGISGFGFGGANAHVVLRSLTNQETLVMKDRESLSLTNQSINWQHKPYWPKFCNDRLPALEKNHLFAAKALPSPLAINQYEFRFNTLTLPEIHDTYGILHVGFYLEMLGFAKQGVAFAIKTMTFKAPLFVPDGKTVVVHLTIDGELFNFYSQDDKGSWIGHASGYLTSMPLTDPEARHFERENSLSGNDLDFYGRISAMGMPSGETIRLTERYWIQGDTILCQLRPPHPSERSLEFTHGFHPGIIDACIQSLFLLLPQSFNKAYITTTIESLVLFKGKVPPAYIYAKIDNWEDEGLSLTGEWTLLDSHYLPIAQCSGIYLKQLGERSNFKPDLASPFVIHWNSPSPTQKSELTTYLCNQFAQVFAMPLEDLDPKQSLNELGMDSLMALTMVQVLEKNMGYNYPLASMMKGPSIEELVQQIIEEQELKGSKIENNHALWLSNRKINPKAKLRLFCFPYGGGGASIYRDWDKFMPDFIEVCPIQLPGRENRIEESPLLTMDAVLSGLTESLIDLMDLPFAFFGHSFGSLIAFEFTRHLRRLHLPQPIHLFASAYPDPKKPSSSLNKLVAHLENEGLYLFDLSETKLKSLNDHELENLTGIFAKNGLIDYADERMNKSIIQVLLPIFIGDMSIVKNYIYQDESPLTMDFTVFYGNKDSWVHPEEISGWEKQTLGNCNSVALNQEHLFVREQEAKVFIINTISQSLRSDEVLEIESTH